MPQLPWFAWLVVGWCTGIMVALSLCKASAKETPKPPLLLDPDPTDTALDAEPFVVRRFETLPPTRPYIVRYVPNDPGYLH